jgi:uncharacterized protein YndB with AHSA1/START domain
MTPVLKSITVKAGPDVAFRVFTQGMDSWWPRTHHIGKSPMKKIVVEGRVGGRCYSEQVGDKECDWGQVLAWDPPKRFVMAWQINAQWQYEPDLAKSSEVEVSFTPQDDGSTRVDLVHRYLERHAAGAEGMRAGVDAPGGWSAVLQLFRERTEEEKS